VRSSIPDSADSQPSSSPVQATKSDYICFSHLRWHFVTQRPQHLLTRIARDRRVFFWEEPIWHAPDELALRHDGGLGMHLDIQKEAASLWVIQPHITWGIDFEVGQRQLLSEFMKQFEIRNPVRWYYTPMALGFSDQLNPETTVYDCMDELSGFLGAPPELAARERQMFQEADVVFTGGVSLYEAKKKQHKNVHAFPSSIDATHFAKARSSSIAEPKDQAAIPHPRAGFYGVVDERFDIDLLAKIAEARPNINFVIIGPVVKIDPASLPDASNIHYLGSKSYAELPAYLSGWDAALMPFAMNDATRYISPTKTPEYLAAGKMVVSTPIYDVVQDYGAANLVAIAANAEDFATALDDALLPPTTEWLQAVDEKLSHSSWDRTWSEMETQIDMTSNFVRDSEIKNSSANLKTDPSLFATRNAEASLKAAPQLSPKLMLPSSLLGRPTNLRSRSEKYDYVVVGAGFAGAVLAERLARSLGKRILIIDKRDHIAGNAYDCYNAEGILIHRYGPHIFHTNSNDVVNYLSQFTSWRPYEHRVLASVDSQLLPIPINLDTINKLYDLNLDAAGMKEFLSSRAVTAPIIKTSEDIVVSRVGRELYEKFFRNYTRKQWGLDPSELDASVAGRIPVRFDQDDRYFSDSFQAMPLDGYTRMFERMLDHPRITIRTGVEYQDVLHSYPDAKVIFTGPIDEYFGFCFGKLPYRSLEFKHETHNVERLQEAAVINYPNDRDYTRVTEFKYLTGQIHPRTSIVYEYPRAAGDPYYPIPRAENTALYEQYKALAERDSNVHFCGRLANYRYYNMDQVVAQALTTFRRIAEQERLTPQLDRLSRDPLHLSQDQKIPQQMSNQQAAVQEVTVA
jgi:UDP-galactopyranose mutase